MYVRIDNIDHYQIFQQENGRADLTVTGWVQDYEVSDRPGHVCANLYRESNGTCATPLFQAEMEGNRYRVVLKDVPAGGLYTLRVRYCHDDDPEWAINGDTRFHLGVGDIWVIAGQSNAVGYGKTPAIGVREERVHLFPLNRVWRDGCEPLSDGACYDFTPVGEGFLTGVSPFGSFAEELVRELNYPIGLLQTAQGGSPLSAWEKGAGLFNNMMEVIQLAGGRVRGIVWHQGCTDCDTAKDASTYLPRFKRFVQDVREALDAPDLPILTAQLNKYITVADSQRLSSWAQVKEAQRQAARQLSNVYVSPTHDLALSDWAHNNAVSCQILGQRMAWIALEKLYGKHYYGMCPDAEDIVLKGDTVEITFGNVHQWLVNLCLPGEECDFEVEDDSGKIPVVACECRMNTVMLKLERTPAGKALCSFAHRPTNSGHLPFDRANAMPPLTFYRAEARKAD